MMRGKRASFKFVQEFFQLHLHVFPILSCQSKLGETTHCELNSFIVSFCSVGLLFHQGNSAISISLLASGLGG